MLNEAVARAVADYGPVDTWYENLPTGITKGDRLSGRIIKYLKVESEYPSGWSNSLVNYLCVTDNSLWRPWNTDYKTYILSDGSLVTIYTHSTAFFVFFADIDGPKKGKNQAGSDLFYFDYRYAKRRLEPETNGIDENSVPPCTIADACAT